MLTGADKGLIHGFGIHSFETGTKLDPIAGDLAGVPTILVGGDCATRGSLVRIAERAGLQTIGSASLASLLWSAISTSPDVLLLDLRGDEGRSWLQHPLASQAVQKTRRVCVLVDFVSLDAAFALLEGMESEILCDPNLADIITMLVSVGLRPASSGPATIRDVAGEGESARLEKLSEEVRRLAHTIERLSGAARSVSALAGAASPSGQALPVAPPTNKLEKTAPESRAAAAAGLSPTESRANAADIRALIRARRLRDEFLPADLFADPAWDMLLDLLAAKLAGQRVSVSSLCIAAAVPPTTALRWITQLTERKILVRLADPTDGRRIFIDLADETADAMLQWVEKVRRKGGLLTPKH